jgi:hypothetical protein
VKEREEKEEYEYEEGRTGDKGKTRMKGQEQERKGQERGRTDLKVVQLVSDEDADFALEQTHDAFVEDQPPNLCVHLCMCVCVCVCVCV